MLVFATILDPFFKSHVLPPGRINEYKEAMVDEILKKRGNVISAVNKMPTEESLSSNPFDRLMSSIDNTPVEELEERLKLRTVNFEFLL